MPPDWLLDDFETESDIVVPIDRLDASIINPASSTMSPGLSGLVLLFHIMGEHDGHHGAWAFHKGGSGRLVPRCCRRAGAGVRRDRCASQAPVDDVIHQDGVHDGRGPRADGTEFSAPIVDLVARPAAYVPRAGRPAQAWWT